MVFWLKKIVGRDPGYNQFSIPGEKLKRRVIQSTSVFSEKGIDIYQRSKSPLDPHDEAIAKELAIASNMKDEGMTKKIGDRLNDSGGIDKMKLLCYRVRHLGGDDRWIEMKWSGIGDWLG